MTKHVPVSKPLALAAMALLRERPMHPYEIAYTIKERHMEECIKLNFGSLYHTIESLESSGCIAPVETGRDGRRPERTVYALTDEGRTRLKSWLEGLIRTPAKDYLRFQAGLCFIYQLDPAEAATLLAERAELMAAEADLWDDVTAELRERGLSRLSLIEIEHAQLVRRAELEWIKTLIKEIEDGSLEWEVHQMADREEKR